MRRPSAVLNGSNLDLRSSNADLNSTLTNNTPRASTPAGGSQVQLRLKPNAPPGLAPSDVKMGERVWINGIKDGTVKFIGETDFAPGVWVGVVLNDKTGKNDGCVNGKRLDFSKKLRCFCYQLPVVFTVRFSSRNVLLTSIYQSVWQFEIVSQNMTFISKQKLVYCVSFDLASF